MVYTMNKMTIWNIGLICGGLVTIGLILFEMVNPFSTKLLSIMICILWMHTVLKELIKNKEKI